MLTYQKRSRRSLEEEKSQNYRLLTVWNRSIINRKIVHLVCELGLKTNASHLLFVSYYAPAKDQLRGLVNRSPMNREIEGSVVRAWVSERSDRISRAAIDARRNSTLDFARAQRFEFRQVQV